MAAQSTGPIVPGTGLEWTGIAIGTALLAGTSAFGRRGGIFGTLLAVAGLTLFLDYPARRNFDIALFAIAAALIGVGLVVTRLVETYGRPLPVAGADEDWTGRGSARAPNWSPDLPETWTPPAPAPNRSETLGRRPLGLEPLTPAALCCRHDLCELRRAGRPAHGGTARARLRQGPARSATWASSGRCSSTCRTRTRRRRWTVRRTRSGPTSTKPSRCGVN